MSVLSGAKAYCRRAVSVGDFVDGPGGALLVDGPGSLLTCDEYVAVGERTGSSSLTVSGGGKIEIQTLSIGGNYAPVGSIVASGLVDVSGANTSAVVTLDSSVGRQGNGKVLVRNGATFEARRFLNAGEWPGSTGEIEIDGPGSRLNFGTAHPGTTTAFGIGFLGTGAVTVKNGGQIMNPVQGIALGNGGFSGSGMLLVSGVGSAVQCYSLVAGGYQDLSPLGTGVVKVADSGALIVSAGVIVLPGSSLELFGGSVLAAGTLNRGVLRGTGTLTTTLTNHGSLEPGDGVGTLPVEGGVGTFLESSGTLVCEVAGLQPGMHDKLASGYVKLGGKLVIRPVGGYMPQCGDTIRIIDTPFTDGAFSEIVVEGSVYGGTTFKDSSGVSVVIGRPVPAISVNSQFLVLAWGGVLDYTLTYDNSCAVPGQEFFFLVGGFSTFNSLVIDGVDLGVALDGYTLLPLSNPNSGIFSHAAGLVGPFGFEVAKLTIPAGAFTGISGVTIFHSFAIFDFAAGRLVAATSPAGVLLL
jgi:T5SS/PEP-CTERM-associated repeat protein